ncbi:hypothetical protein MVEN_01942900 [Mycena venus]|uniref:Uncharacterized protein n=1 Tax=Mycena venus TaxID=2733690 RepID=A0A8H7CLD9_9AGAR|nr:hypothetical protein MVEN_01942900 [Mycena venus]
MGVLPDEIISHILLLSAIKVPDETFSDTAVVSPFASYAQSTSAFLLVCKDWLRVSTPLLYNVVVIRSKAQALALEAALKSNKDLGTFIKKLRVEGGYGQAMKHILKASPNITDLCLSLAIWSSDAVSGLCQSLHMVNPVRLIIHDVSEPGNNKQNLQLVEKVAECLKLWKRLKTVDVPYAYDWGAVGISRCARIYEALKTAPALEEVLIPFPDFMTTLQFLNDLRRNPSIKRVTIKQPLPYEYSIMLAELLDANADLKDLLHFTISEYDRFAEIGPSSNPLFVPMESAPQEQRDKIWERVLYFAFHTDELEAHLASDVHIPNRTYREIHQMAFFASTFPLLVSKQFKRLSAPFFYRHVGLEGPSDLARFAACLKGDSSVAKHVRSLCVYHEATLQALPDNASFNSDEEWYDQNQPSQTEELLPSIFQSLDGLVSFTGGDYNPALYPPRPQIHKDAGCIAVSWTVFQTLAATAGATLRRLCLEVNPPSDPQPPLILESFVSLRSLEWKCTVEFSLNSEPVLAPDSLANLECLSLVDYHPSFLEVLAAAELPALRRIYFYRDVAPSAQRFFERHGTKLTEAMIVAEDPGEINVLDACPTLPGLICGIDETKGENTLPSVDLFSPSEPHLHLSRLVLDVCVYSRKEEKALGEFFDSIDTALFPALREIQVSELYWPITEREISKSLWVQWAERLLTRNIKLIDMDEKHWTPRLKKGGR